MSAPLREQLSGSVERVRGLRRSSDGMLIVGLTLLTLFLGGLMLVQPTLWPLSMLVVPMVLATLFLEPRSLPWFVTFVLVVLAVLTQQQDDLTPRIALSVGTVLLLGLIVLVISFRRARLGVAGSTGEDLLVDLRDRLQRQGELPDLPAGWFIDSTLRSAGGTPFAGDFLVIDRFPDEDRLAVVVVDVSGKGIKAGSRSLLLTGAMGGLLSALPPEQFLGAANDYLLRQQWSEGFATAVHLSLDLRTGAFEVRSAGHPPALRLCPTGGWEELEADGPILGVLDGAEYDAAKGQLGPGETLLLYTDGMVETRTEDLGTGIERLARVSGELLARDVDGAGRRIVETVGAHDDDRMVLLLHRRP